MQMFDESFFVALAFATVVAAFLFLKLPQRLLAALDAKSAEIADELQQARKLREEADRASPLCTTPMAVSAVDTAPGALCRMVQHRCLNRTALLKVHRPWPDLPLKDHS